MSGVNNGNKRRKLIYCSLSPSNVIYDIERKSKFSNYEKSLVFETLFDDRLQRAALERRWDRCRELLMTEPTAEVSRLIQYRDEYGSVPHIACRFDAPGDVVEELARRSSSSLLWRDESHGNVTALHVACAHASDEAVVALVRSCPAAAALPCDGGWLPLHVALCSRRPHGPVAVHALLVANPDAVYGRPTALSLFLSGWREKQHEQQRLETQQQQQQRQQPQGQLVEDGGRLHVPDANDDNWRAAETLSLLLQAYVRGNVRRDPCRPWLAFHEALRLRRELDLPTDLLCHLWQPHLNLPLHILCAARPTTRR